MEEECKHERIIRTDKESYCEKCGLVLPSEMVGDSIEYDIQKNRYYKREPTSFRFYDDGIGTIRPVEGYRDAEGKKLTLSQRQLVYKLRRASRLNPKKGYNHIKTYTRGYKEIESITSLLGTAQQTRDTAILLFKRARKEGCIRGRILETSAAACVWLAYRCDKRVPPTMCQIIQGMTNKTDEKSLIRATRIIKRKLGMKYEILPTESYIAFYSNQLGIDVKTRNDAINMYNDYVICRKENTDELLRRYKMKQEYKGSKKLGIELLYIPQSSPAAIAATVVYLATVGTLLIPITQEQVCEIAGITEVTLRNQKMWITISNEIVAEKLRSNQE